MANFYNLLVLPVSRKPIEMFRFLQRDNVINIRTLRTTATKPTYSSLGKRNNQFVSSPVKNNARFNSDKPEKPKDRFIPKDEFADKNLWKPLLTVLTIGGICTAFMMYLKNEKMLAIEKERKRALGKAAIGGKFELIDQDNKVRKSDDFLGQWLMIYFGFTHCPDICPDEMEKLVQVVEKIEKDKSLPNLTPIFISVDPERDTPSVVGKYVKEFSDKFIGLTGTMEQVAATCKAFRVYFSAGPKDKDSDYIVDHSIIMYLIDPNGEFLDYYGQNSNADQIVDGYKFNVRKYEHLNEKGVLQKMFS